MITTVIIIMITRTMTIAIAAAPTMTIICELSELAGALRLRAEPARPRGADERVERRGVAMGEGGKRSTAGDDAPVVGGRGLGSAPPNSREVAAVVAAGERQREALVLDLEGRVREHGREDVGVLFSVDRARRVDRAAARLHEP